MGFGDLPILSMLKSRMHWQQDRQRILAENVSNADPPGYRARDLSALRFDEQMVRPATSVALQQTASGHLSAIAGGGDSQFRSETGRGYEVRPAGNVVSLEDEMMKVAANQMDYQAATALYTRGLALLKTAMGKR
jgi:flagellar basal-body rod protein FlgB